MKTPLAAGALLSGLLLLAAIGVAAQGKARVDETLVLVDLALIAKRIGQLRQDLAQHLALAPLLESSMHRLVVRVALRKHVPLRTRVQYPQHRLEHFARRDGLASRTTFGNILLGKMLPDSLPLFVTQSQHE